MKNNIENQIKYSEKKLTELKERLIVNFCYELPWIGEDIYKYQYKLEHYKTMLAELENESEEAVVKYWTERFTKFISETYNVRENSTGSLFREVSTWKFICNMELLKELKSI